LSLFFGPVLPGSALVVFLFAFSPFSLSFRAPLKMMLLATWLTPETLDVTILNDADQWICDHILILWNLLLDFVRIWPLDGTLCPIFSDLFYRFHSIPHFQFTLSSTGKAIRPSSKTIAFDFEVLELSFDGIEDLATATLA